MDLHTHLYTGVSHYGVDPDTYCLRRGVTTAVDAGSAGAQTLPGFRRYVIERSQTRILAFLHIAVAGHDHEPGRRAGGHALGVAGAGHRAGPGATRT